MTGLLVPKDSERVTRDAVAALLSAHGSVATVGVGVPREWTLGSAPHVQVSDDGTAPLSWPVATRSPMRLVAWSGSTTTSKALAGLCAVLLHRYSGAGIAHAEWLTGPITARDPDTRAELAYITVSVVLRSVAA